MLSYDGKQSKATMFWRRYVTVQPVIFQFKFEGEKPLNQKPILLYAAES